MQPLDTYTDQNKKCVQPHAKLVWVDDGAYHGRLDGAVERPRGKAPMATSGIQPLDTYTIPRKKCAHTVRVDVGVYHGGLDGAAERPRGKARERDAERRHLHPKQIAETRMSRAARLNQGEQCS